MARMYDGSPGEAMLEAESLKPLSLRQVLPCLATVGLAQPCMQMDVAMLCKMALFVGVTLAENAL